MMDDKKINAFAVVLKKMIAQDGKTTQKEMQKFTSFFVEEYNLNNSEARELYERVDVDDFSLALEHIGSLAPMEKMKFMNHINQVIISDDIDGSEYELFEEIKNRLFER
jgi:uncharacterized tellurite resistance protein B-like protein